MALTIKPIRLNKEDAAAYIGVSGRKLQTLVSEKRLRVVRDHANGAPYFMTEELERFVREQAEKQETSAA